MEKKELSSENKIDKLISIQSKIILNAVDPAKFLFPIHPVEGAFFCGKDFWQSLSSVLHSLHDKGHSDEQIAEKFIGSSRLCQCFWQLDVIKHSGLEKDERVWITNKLLTYLSILRKGNTFCDGGSNTIWSEERVNESIKNLKFSKPDHIERQTVNALSAALWSYTELIYFMYHPTGHEFHGPYKVGDDKLLVKNFYDLKPAEIWSFTEKLNFGRVDIFELYEGDTDIQIDVFGRGIITPHSCKHKLKEVAVLIDGKLVDPSDIKDNLDNLSEVIAAGSKVIESSDEQALIKKFCELLFYRLRPIFELDGRDWYIPKEVEENCTTKYDTLMSEWNKIKDTVSFADEEGIKKVFDPRL